MITSSPDILGITTVSTIYGIEFQVRAMRLLEGKQSPCDVVYHESDIDSISIVNEENYRSVGGAAVGAIIGGVLTGGLGLIAGAAIGGRKRYSGHFYVKFYDGSYAVFLQSSKTEFIALSKLSIESRIKNEVLLESPRTHVEKVKNDVKSEPVKVELKEPEKEKSTLGWHISVGICLAFLYFLYWV